MKKIFSIKKARNKLLFFENNNGGADSEDNIVTFHSQLDNTDDAMRMVTDMSGTCP